MELNNADALSVQNDQIALPKGFFNYIDSRDSLESHCIGALLLDAVCTYFMTINTDL